jgi:hypothetical protein
MTTPRAFARVVVVTCLVLMLPLAAQAQDLTVAYAWWNLDVERRSVRQRYSPCPTVDRIEEVDVETVSGIRTTAIAVPLAGSTKES